MSLDEQFIGIKSRSEECAICQAAPRLNEITMDLLLSRKAPEEIICPYQQQFIRRLDRCATLEDLAIHAEHCDKAMVPDDYVFDPTKYEEGERQSYRDERERLKKEAETRVPPFRLQPDDIR